jgi:hypothetical protein
VIAAGQHLMDLDPACRRALPARCGRPRAMRPWSMWLCPADAESAAYFTQ